MLRHLGTLTRKFEQIRLTLQDKEVQRLADDAAHKAAAHHEAMVREGALLEPGEFISRLNWTRQALSKALTSQRVFFVEVHGSRYFPAFFESFVVNRFMGLWPRVFEERRRDRACADPVMRWRAALESRPYAGL